YTLDGKNCGLLSFESSSVISTVAGFGSLASGLTFGFFSTAFTFNTILSLISRSSLLGSFTLIHPLAGSILNAPEGSLSTYLNSELSPLSASNALTCSTVNPLGKFSITVTLYRLYSNMGEL